MKIGASHAYLPNHAGGADATATSTARATRGRWSPPPVVSSPGTDGILRSSAHSPGLSSLNPTQHLHFLLAARHTLHCTTVHHYTTLPLGQDLATGSQHRPVAVPNPRLWHRPYSTCLPPLSHLISNVDSSATIMPPPSNSSDRCPMPSSPPFASNIPLFSPANRQPVLKHAFPRLQECAPGNSIHATVDP